MATNKNNTYYYNVASGVTPANHNIVYDYDVLVSSDNGDYKKAVARLEVENPKPFGDYLEDATGHYVEGVDSWQDAHDHLIDLVQAMAEELVRNTPVGCDVKEYTAIINESYADGTYIDYCVDIYIDELSQNLSIDCSAELEDKVAGEYTLRQMMNLNAEKLYTEYL